MTILYIHQYFKTPSEPGGTRSYWIAKKMIDKGYKVIMLTCTNEKSKKGKIINTDGIKVHYLNIPYDQKMGVISRLHSFIKFMVLSIYYLFKLRLKYDKIYATSTPLTVGIPALFGNFFLNKPYIFEVRDLWPEVPIQMGVIKNPFFIFILKKLERLIYRRAKTIITLSPGMKEGVLNENICADKVLMIPNMSKPKEFYPRAKNQYYFEEKILSRDKLNIIYFGSIGKTNGLEEVINFFGEIRKKPLELIIAGSGSEKEKLVELTNFNKYHNIKFLGNYDMSVISELVNCCDISLVSFDNIPILSTNSPNKFFDSLSAGKPIIVNSNGWTKDIVINYKCGYYYERGNFESFLKMIDEIMRDKEDFMKMGEISRNLSLTMFDKERLTELIVQQL